MLRTSPKIPEADGHYPPLDGQLHVSAAQPPPANIQKKLCKAPTTVPDSHSVGSFLPPGTRAAVRPATAVRGAEILIENARLEFRVNDRKQTLAIESNRERMALSFHENQSKTASKMPAPQGNDVVLRAKDRGRGVVLRGRRLKPTLLKSAKTTLRPNGLAAHRIGVRGSKNEGDNHGQA
jgi:hypothetical protein